MHLQGLFSLQYALARTRTHAHAHTRTRAYAHTRIHAHAHARTHAHTHTSTRAHKHTSTHSHTHTRTHAHAHTHACMHACMHTHARARTHVRSSPSCHARWSAWPGGRSRPRTPRRKPAGALRAGRTGPSAPCSRAPRALLRPEAGADASAAALAAATAAPHPWRAGARRAIDQHGAASATDSGAGETGTSGTARPLRAATQTRPAICTPTPARPRRLLTHLTTSVFVMTQPSLVRAPIFFYKKNNAALEPEQDDERWGRWCEQPPAPGLHGPGRHRCAAWSVW